MLLNVGCTSCNWKGESSFLRPFKSVAMFSAIWPAVTETIPEWPQLELVQVVSNSFAQSRVDQKELLRTMPKPVWFWTSPRTERLHTPARLLGSPELDAGQQLGLTGVREDGAPPCTPADNAHPNATRVLLTLLCHKGAWLGYIHLSTSLTSLFLPFLGSCLPVSQPSACSGAQLFFPWCRTLAFLCWTSWGSHLLVSPAIWGASKGTTTLCCISHTPWFLSPVGLSEETLPSLRSLTMMLNRTGSSSDWATTLTAGVQLDFFPPFHKNKRFVPPPTPSPQPFDPSYFAKRTYPSNSAGFEETQVLLLRTCKKKKKVKHKAELSKTNKKLLLIMWILWSLIPVPA